MTDTNYTNQGLQQASVRAVTGTTSTFNGDFMALFAQAGITESQYDGALLAWINQKLSASYTNLPNAMQAFAVDQGYLNWTQMGTFNAA